MPGQVWAVNSLGGFMYSLNLSKKLRMAVMPLTKFRQFANVKDASFQGKKKGETYHWDIFSQAATQGGTLTETATMPETNFTITQGTLTITEYGNSVPYTGKLDDLSMLPVTEIINKVMKNDALKAFDIAAHAQFDLSYLRVQPTGGTDTSAVSITTNSAYAYTNSSTAVFNNEHAKSVVDAMKERNIPAYTGDDYYAISWPSTLRVFRNALEDIQQYTSEGFRMIANGEIGRYYNTRYVEQTNIAKAGWTNADWIYFFGDDTVAEAIAVPEEIRGKIPGDYGRSMGVAWYYLGGFGIVHNTSPYSQNRILKWGSLT